MNELLISEITPRAEKNQLSKKLYKGPKALIVTMPCVSFFSATLYDCGRSNGLALNVDYATIKPHTINIPVDFAAPVPSAHLCESLARIEEVWVLKNEKASRMVTEAILAEVLLNESLLGFCGVKNDWEGVEFEYTGDVDYMIGSSETKSVDTVDSSLLVVQARQEWPDSSVAQVLCEAGCLLKRRLAVGKNTPVFAALTNGLFFLFFAIDTDGVVYSSGLPLILGYGPEGDYTKSPSL